MMKNRFVTIVCWLTVALFLYTAISKLSDLDVFREQMATSPWFYPVAGLMVWLLPAAEIVAAGLLLIQKYRKLGLYLSLVLMLLFTVYVLVLMQSHEKLSCSCGGFIDALSWKQHLGLNGMFLVLLTSALLTQRNARPRSEVYS